MLPAGRASLANLPPDLLPKIASFCTDRALDGLACTCSWARECAREEWRGRLLARFPHSTWRGVRDARRACLALERLDETRWIERTPVPGTAPWDRGGQASSVVDSGAGRAIVVHGGANGEVFHSDSFALTESGSDVHGASGIDGGNARFTWTALASADAPSPRWAHSAVSLESDVVIFGGHWGVHGALGDLAVLDCASARAEQWRWVASSDVEVSGDGPCRRHSHACCAHAGVLWLCAGIKHGAAEPELPGLACANDLYSATVVRLRSDGRRATASGPSRGGSNSTASRQVLWTRHDPNGPLPSKRFGHTLCSVRAGVCMFGGRAIPGGMPGGMPAPCSELWILRGASDATPAAPAASSAEHGRGSGGSALPSGRVLPAHPQLGVGGSLGFGTSGRREALRWERLETRGAPPARAFHACVALGDSILILGGEGEAASLALSELDVSYLDDMHLLRLTAARAVGRPGGGGGMGAGGSSGGGAGEGEGGAGGNHGNAATTSAAGTSVTGAGTSVAVTDAPAAASASTAYADDDDDAPPTWRAVIPAGYESAPPSSLASVHVVGGSLFIFGGFNLLIEADLSRLHTIALLPPGCEYE